ncbi:unnamed protein product, partial [Polarella glacialis]
LSNPGNSSDSDPDVEDVESHIQDHPDKIFSEAQAEITEGLLPDWARRVGAVANVSLRLCGVLPVSNFCEESRTTPQGRRPFSIRTRVALSGSYRALLLLMDLALLVSTVFDFSSQRQQQEQDREQHHQQQQQHEVSPSTSPSGPADRFNRFGSHHAPLFALDIVVAAGGMLTILACGVPFREAWGSSRELRACTDALEIHGLTLHFAVEWEMSWWWEALAVFLMWLGMVGVRLVMESFSLGMLSGAGGEWCAVRFALFLA